MWLPGARVIDLSGIRGNGPFREFRGVVLHVNDAPGNGTADSFWGAGSDVNPYQVCPNFQIDGAGRILQLLPLNWQPWCQMDGNAQWAAIECAGVPTLPMTDSQTDAAARIVAAYHANLGLVMQISNNTLTPGLGTHGMGGPAWGNHPGCPGTIRAAQRRVILDRASGIATKGFDTMLDPADRKLLTDLTADVADVNRRVGIALVGRHDDQATPSVDEHVDGLAQVMARLDTIDARLATLAPPAAP